MRASLSRGIALAALALIAWAGYASADDADPTRASLVVKVPTEDATLYVQGAATKATGKVRTLSTPVLTAGKSYTYTFRAVWKEDGKEKSRETNVKVTPGQTYDVDLATAEKEPAVKDPPKKDPVAKDPVVKDPPKKDPVVKDPEPKKDPMAKDPEPKKDPMAKDPEPKKEAIVKDPVVKDPMAKDPEPKKDPMAKDPEPIKEPGKEAPKVEAKEEPKAEEKKDEEKKDAAPEVKAADIVNPLNTVWTLVAAFLVFGMQVGFTMLEAGFCRSRETVNVLMECVVDTCLCGLLFFAFGFAFMFGHGNGFIGWGDADGKHWFLLQNMPATYEATGVAFLAFWLFQFAFADTCSTITSGAMIGRTGFVGDLIYSFFVSGFIYPIIGHWAWGPDGFLATMGSPADDGSWRFLPELGMSFHDFAGSTVVHTIGGFVALAGAIVLGPRLGRRFKRDGGGPMLPHDLTIATCGGLLLWFGWYGFNPGSTLSAMDFQGIGRVAANTTLAACAAGLSAMLVAWIPSRKWDVSFTVNGFLAGLVAITCPCYWVSPAGSIGLGAIAGVVVVLGVELLEWLRIDDPIGAVPVHGICGIWGTLSLGLFASGEYTATGPGGPDATAPLLTGLFYGGGLTVLKAQAIGSAIITLATFGVSLVVMYSVHLMGLLRVSKEGELEGLDVHEHGINAYPEYVISSMPAAHAEMNGVAEPKSAVIPPNGDRRFTVVVQGADHELLTQTWSSLCQPSEDSPTKEFLLVYPHMTTLQGNRFRFRGGDPELIRDSVERLLQTQMRRKGVKANLE